MKTTTIEEISTKRGYDPDRLECFLDWVLEYPGELSIAIRKTIVHMVVGAGCEPPSESLEIDPEFLEELRNLEVTAQYLQEFAEAKQQHRFKREAATRDSAKPAAFCSF